MGKAADTALIKVVNLGKSFDVSEPFLQRVVTRSGRKIVNAVDGVSFSIERGTTFSIVGESGCGKSTITRLVAGLDRPTAGEIAFNTPDAAPVRLQMVFQDPIGSLNPRWRIGRSIAEPMDRTMDGNARRERVGELLKTVGLAPADAGKYPHEFSGGQRQRISIARALAADAELLLLDEPTSALDVSVQSQVLNLLKDLQERLGLTYLFISHNLSVVRFLTDRIGVMYLGRLVEEGSGQAVFDTPQHPYTKLLLETIPDMENPKRDRAPLTGDLPSPLKPPSGCVFHPRCPLAMEVCSTVRPELQVVENGSNVACHAVAQGAAMAAPVNRYAVV
ncbi:ATP-binding cassette domain-containing protein [Shinella curvata]|uniref:ATP-binding cassette domain-containing protein n=1 Tax=Shinella curvata TaxID=1817964 RepID=A0ABT8XHV5_9HYPH|nr:oligopeptide/dipeptide ABC transporter ATP-binding protein [Shinella curvata]MCJ8056086.1 ATP-binding cassette domain-containing protein [Shinella curvata]MDO6123313.1 ATP-binding cassette domain-containing protein [Shinella curvata]